MDPLDVDLLRQQEQSAIEQGIAEAVALLQHPEDLARLPALTRDHEARARAARAAVAAAASARVDALGLGTALLGKSHRHIARLRGALARVDALCAECALLVGGDNHDAIRALSVAHANARRVLGELDDVVDLPARAEAVQRAFLPPAPGPEEEEDGRGDDDFCYGDSSGGGGEGGADFFGGGPGDGGGAGARRRGGASSAPRDVGSRHAGELFRAFEGLTVIEGTANNSKEAWRRSAAARGGGGGFGGGFGGSASGAGARANPQQQQRRNDNNTTTTTSTSNPDGLRELSQYLSCVSKAMENFERRLWGRLRDFQGLARGRPGLLVDAARVVQAQEAMDAHWAGVRASYVRPKHWKERCVICVLVSSCRRLARGLMGALSLFGSGAARVFVALSLSPFPCPFLFTRPISLPPCPPTPQKQRRSKNPTVPSSR